MGQSEDHRALVRRIIAQEPWPWVGPRFRACRCSACEKCQWDFKTGHCVYGFSNFVEGFNYVNPRIYYE